jgi:hypothetical protein
MRTATPPIPTDTAAMPPTLSFVEEDLETMGGVGEDIWEAFPTVPVVVEEDDVEELVDVDDDVLRELEVEDEKVVESVEDDTDDKDDEESVELVEVGSVELVELGGESVPLLLSVTCEESDEDCIGDVP